jgi:hypothetical protein
MCSSLAPERLDGFYLYSGFMSLSVLGHSPVNVNIPATRIGALKMGPKTHDGDCIKNGPNNFD